MKKLLIPSVYVFVFLLINSCSKDEPPIDGAYDIAITIIEPGDGEVFNSGDELHLEIDFERTGTIHYLDVLVMNETTGDTMYYSGTVHADATDYYPFHEHTDIFTGITSDCRVIASSWEHDPMEKISEEVHFTVNP